MIDFLAIHGDTLSIILTIIGGLYFFTGNIKADIKAYIDRFEGRMEALDSKFEAHMEKLDLDKKFDKNFKSPKPKTGKKRFPPAKRS